MCVFHAGLTQTVLIQQISPCAIFVIITDKNVKLTSTLLHVLYLYIFVFVSPCVGGSIVPPGSLYRLNTSSPGIIWAKNHNSIHYINCQLSAEWVGTN